MSLKAGGVLACGLAAAGVALAGCGGSEEPLTNQEFVRQGNAICRGISDDTVKAIADLPDDATRPETREYIRDNILPITVDAMREIGDLDLEDAGTESKVDEMVADTEAAAEEITTSDKAFARASARGGPLQPAADIAEELNLTQCFPALQSSAGDTPSGSIEVTPSP